MSDGDSPEMAEFRKSIGAGLDASAWEHDGDGLSITVGGACPVQGEGTLDGLPVYFRARGGEWTFGIAATPGGDPVGVGMRLGGEDVPGWWFEGDDDDFGWMKSEDSLRAVFACAAAWRARADKTAPTCGVRLELPESARG